jgi:hypothetical protein
MVEAGWSWANDRSGGFPGSLLLPVQGVVATTHVHEFLVGAIFRQRTLVHQQDAVS